MGRLNNWLDRPTQERETELDILYDQVSTVDVYRTSETGDNPGVTDEIDDQTYLRTINVRLDKPLYRSDTYDFLAMTDDVDVQRNDLWKCLLNDGRVYFIRVEHAEARPTGCEVQLHYA